MTSVVWREAWRSVFMVSGRAVEEAIVLVVGAERKVSLVSRRGKVVFKDELRRGKFALRRPDQRGRDAMVCGELVSW
jgi:hypothetical protein